MATTTASEEKICHPIVKWAQRHDRLYLTIDVEDIDPKAEVTLDKTSLYFNGKAGHDNKTYQVRLLFFSEVDPTRSKERRTGREMFFNIYKKGNAYWPRLLKEAGKVHYLKIDFNRWRDEDESDEEVGGGPGGAPDDRSLEDMMRQMSSGTPGMPDMDDLKPPSEEDSDDSDDEDLPDLEDTTDTKE